MNWRIGLIAVAVAPLVGRGADLPKLPDKEGFAGPFAGVSNGSLVVAGGANFPDKKPWDGGKKVWTDAVFVLDKPDGKWVEAGELSAPRVTVPVVVWNKSWVVPSGEVRPGVRSPDVWAWTPGRKE